MRTLLILMMALSLSLSGCAMMGGEDDTGSGTTAKDVDSVHMRNGDVLVGEVALTGEALEIATDYLDKLRVERRHLESLSVLANGSVKLYTRYGDILNGKLGSDHLELRTKTGGDVSLTLESIQKVTFAE